MLLGANCFQAQLLAFANLRQAIAGGVGFVLLFFFVLHRSVSRQVAFELHHRTCGAERVARGVHVDRGLVENRGHHLRRDEALPNHLVELEHVVIEKAANAFGRARDVRGTNRFVRFLRILLRFEKVGLFGQEAWYKARADVFANLLDRIRGNAHRIRAHVSDQRFGTFIAQLDALIEALREHHRAARGVAKAVVPGLLELRRGEWRRRETALFLLRHARPLPNRFIDRSENPLRFGLVGNLDVLALVFDELGFERWRLARSEKSVNRPVFPGDERPDFLFALDDQTERDRLNAPSGKTSANFVPQDRRNLVADQPVEDAAGLLRVDQVHVYLRGMLEGGFDCLLRDFVEHHAINLGRSRASECLDDGFLGCLGARRGLVAVFAVLFGLGIGLRGDFRGLFGHDFRVLARVAEDFLEVVADCFTFAVRVARQVDGFGGRGGLLQVANHLQLGRDDLVGRLEDVFGGNRYLLHRLLLDHSLAFALRLPLGLLFAILFAGQKNTDGLLGQVHHVPVGSLHGVIPAQVFIDRLGLGRRLDDYE